MKWKSKRDPLDRLLDKIEIVGDCWVYRGATVNGYGRLGVELRTIYTHRYAYERFVGPIPSELVIDHLCRVRACCNPEHLETVTQRENCLRGERAGIRVTACQRAGHPYTDENTYVNRQGYRSCRACKRERAAA